MSPANAYRLHIYIKRPIRLEIGALGRHTLPSGTYIYTGSARRNLEKRLERHCRKEKTKRWHIDYLTSHPAATIAAIERLSGKECELNQDTKGYVLIPGFGASDCRSGCGAHLKYVAAQGAAKHTR